MDINKQSYTGEAGLTEIPPTLLSPYGSKYGVVLGNDHHYSTLVLLINRQGIHARPSAMIVNLASQYNECEIWAERGNEKINAKDILAWMTLEAPFGTEVKLTAKGKSCAEVLEKMVILFNSKFNED